MHPEAGSQGANALWLSQSHHPEGTGAPPHTRKASQQRRVSPLHLGGEREVSAQSPISLIGNRDVSGAWPIGIWPQHLFQPVQPKSGHFPLHLSPSERVYRSGRDQRQEPPAAVFCCYLSRIGASGLRTMAGLGLGISLGGSRESIGCHPSASSGATD